MKLVRYAKGNPPSWANDPVENIRDTFALPRDPEHAIHLAEGDWMYLSATDPARQQALLREGWQRCHIPTLFKFTVWEVTR